MRSRRVLGLHQHVERKPGLRHVDDIVGKRLQPLAGITGRHDDRGSAATAVSHAARGRRHRAGPAGARRRRSARHRRHACTAPRTPPRRPRIPRRAGSVSSSSAAASSRTSGSSSTISAIGAACGRCVAMSPPRPDSGRLERHAHIATATDVTTADQKNRPPSGKTDCRRPVTIPDRSCAKLIVGAGTALPVTVGNVAACPAQTHALAQ